MAKQTSASQPAAEQLGGFSRKQFYLFGILALALIALLGLGFSQLQVVKAQTATPTINFGNQLVGTTSGAQTATFTNSTGFTATITGVSVTNPTDFSVGGGCSGDIPDGGSCSVPVTFHPATAGPKTGSVTFSYDTFVLTSLAEGRAAPNAPGSVSTALTGTGVAPTTTAPTTAPPTTAPPTTAPPTTVPTTNAPTTRASAPCGSQIQGYVVVDGKPGQGLVVKLEGPTSAQVQIGEGGFFYFNNLCAGTFKISVVYDATKYTPNTSTSYTIQTDGVNAYRDNAFGLVTAQATTAVATTAAPTTAVGTTPAATTPAVTTPAGTPVGTTAAAASCPAGPATPTGTRLRVKSDVVQVNGTQFLVCIGVAAGDSPVNLNDTVIVNLPAGAVVTQATANQGTVTTSGTSTRWGAFSLNAKQTASLVLSVNAPSGNLNGSSIFVSGSFNRAQAFQQRLPGFAGTFDIAPAVQTNTGGGNTGGNTGGQGGGQPSVPSQAPATGTGGETDQQSPVLLLIIAIIASAGLGIFGLFLTGRKQPSNKEQK